MLSHSKLTVQTNWECWNLGRFRNCKQITQVHRWFQNFHPSNQNHLFFTTSAVTIYGSCASKLAPNQTISSKIRSHGYWTLFKTIKNFKFYLAFENSVCKDYITEKFFQNALLSGVVPIVLGGRTRKDYEKFVPGDSFIHVHKDSISWFKVIT